ncbi:MAG: hypothetical protein ACFUZC_16480 [Chthoniobacteraceae bacterium]
MKIAVPLWAWPLHIEAGNGAYGDVVVMEIPPVFVAYPAEAWLARQAFHRGRKPILDEV